MGRLIVDADVLIDYLRGYAEAKRFIHQQREKLALSVMTLLELYAGFRGDVEEKKTMALCSYFEKIDVTEPIAVQAGYYRNRYGKSSGTGIVDAILAATAEAENATLVTLNKKHYPMLKDVLVPYKKH